MFAGQTHPKTKARSGFGKIIDSMNNYFFGMFQEDFPRYGYLLLSENLRLIKVDLRPYLGETPKLFNLGDSGKKGKKQIKSNSTEDNTPKISAEKATGVSNSGLKDTQDWNLIECFKIVKFGVIYDFELCTEYHGELKALHAHGTGFLRV